MCWRGCVRITGLCGLWAGMMWSLPGPPASTLLRMRICCVFYRTSALRQCHRLPQDIPGHLLARLPLRPCGLGLRNAGPGLAFTLLLGSPRRGKALHRRQRAEAP